MNKQCEPSKKKKLILSSFAVFAVALAGYAVYMHQKHKNEKRRKLMLIWG
jgi:hypothetical protein